MGLCPGELRNRVQIKFPYESVDSAGYGEAIPDDRIFATAHVKIEPQSGREFFRASQVYPTMTHLVTMRYIPGVTAKMKLVLNGRDLNIISIQNMQEDNRVLRLVCMEAVP